MWGGGGGGGGGGGVHGGPLWPMAYRYSKYLFENAPIELDIGIE